MLDKDNSEVAEAQKLMLQMLLAVHNICEENNITYWLVADTLLGAVCYRGFIPWDDDLDIAMVREEYERFLEIAPKYLPENMFLQTRETDKESPLPFAKIRMSGTELIEKGEEKCHNGIFMGIFPHDYYPSGWFIDWMKWGRLIRDRKKKYPKGSWKRILVAFYTNVILIIPVQITVLVRKFLEKHPEWFQNKNWPYCTYSLESASPKRTRVRDIFPVKKFNKIFEGEDFYIPSNANNVLTGEFGHHFMTPLPVKSRNIYAKSIKTSLEQKE